jgi:hypothetical protein
MTLRLQRLARVHLGADRRTVKSAFSPIPQVFLLDFYIALFRLCVLDRISKSRVTTILEWARPWAHGRFSLSR